MILTIPDEIARAAQELAESGNLSPQDLLLRALQAHFPPLDSELQDEFDAWERASDEDMARLDNEVRLV